MEVVGHGRAFEHLMKIMRHQEPAPQDLEDLNRLLSAHPAVLAVYDEQGMTPLVASIVHDAHMDVQLLLLEAYARMPALNAAGQTWKGKFPIHLAMDRHVKLPVIQKLVAISPETVKERDEDGRYLLHMVLECVPFPLSFIDFAGHVLQIFPEAAAVPSRDIYPLHFCLLNGLPHRLLVQVLAANRAAAGVPTWDGKLPLHIALEMSVDVRTVAVLLTANPQAMLRKMPNQMTVLEYVLQQKRPVQMVECLLYGSADKKVSKHALACCRASAMGRIHIVTTDSAAATGAQALHRGRGHRAADSEKKSLQLMVQWCEEEPIAVEVDPRSKVQVLKHQIQVLKKVPAQIQRLSFEGKQLLDNDFIETYHIPANNTVLARAHSDTLSLALVNKAHASLLTSLIRFDKNFAMEDDRNGHLPLHLALKNRADTEVVMELIDANPLAARVIQKATTQHPYPLHLALQCHYPLEVIQKLLDVPGCSAKDWHQDGSYNPQHVEDLRAINPLNVAIEAEARKEVIHLLLDRKCSLYARCPDSRRTALECAIVNRRETLLHHLLKLLNKAAQQGQRAQAERMVEELGPYDRQTPLHLAVVNGASKEAVAHLCSISKKPTEIRDPAGCMPIHAAVKNRASFAVVRELLEQNPRVVQAPDGRGRTPLQLAVSHEAPAGICMEICQMDKSAAQTQDAAGRSPIEIAVAADAPPWIVEELMKMSKEGEFTPCQLQYLQNMWPRNRASAECSQLLRGADLCRRNNHPGNNDELQDMLDKLHRDEQAMLGAVAVEDDDNDPAFMLPRGYTKIDESGQQTPAASKHAGQKLFMQTLKNEVEEEEQERLRAIEILKAAEGKEEPREEPGVFAAIGSWFGW